MAPLIRGSSIYTIVDGPTWAQSESNAVKLGGHLVTINDASENSYLFASFALSGDWNNPSYTTLWAGFTDVDSEGQWHWANGELTSYANWVPLLAEPYIIDVVPDGGSYENYLHLGRFLGGYWNDANDYNSRAIQGIAESPFIRRGNSAYVIVQGPSWEEAEANAVKLGGHLLTINDAAENDFIYDRFKPAGQGLWIGLSTIKNGTWQWSDGETALYRN